MARLSPPGWWQRRRLPPPPTTTRQGLLLLRTVQHQVRHGQVVPVVLHRGAAVLPDLVGTDDGVGGGADHAQPLRVAVDVPEGPEADAAVHVHEDAGNTSVLGELHGAVGPHTEAELVAFLRRVGNILHNR